MKVAEKIIPELENLFSVDENLLPKLGTTEFDNFVEVEEELTTIKENLKEITLEESTLVNELYSFLSTETNATSFATATGYSPELVFTIVALANILPEAIWEEDYDTDFDDFNLQEIIDLDYVYDTNKLRVRTQVSEKESKTEDAISLLDLREISTLDQIKNDLNFQQLDGSNKYIISIIKSLLSIDKTSEVLGNCWASTKSDNKNDFVTTIKYQAVLNGNIITFPHKHKTIAPHSEILSTLSARSQYTQYHEPIMMLGEINSKTSTLETYLSSYHVLENYMLRARIAEVTTQTPSNQKKFRIRDFKRLEIAVEHKEMPHLKNLFEKSKNLRFGGVEFHAIVEGFRDTLVAHPDYDQEKMNEILRNLSIVTKSGTVVDINDDDQLQANIHKIVYMIRCSIVHNKETEFHISNKELSDKNLSLLLRELAIPVMQKIAFGLPSVTSDNPIEYKVREIALY